MRGSDCLVEKENEEERRASELPSQVPTDVRPDNGDRNEQKGRGAEDRRELRSEEDSIGMKPGTDPVGLGRSHGTRWVSRSVQRSVGWQVSAPAHGSNRGGA